jgi:exonuclease SbcD
MRNSRSKQECVTAKWKARERGIVMFRFIHTADIHLDSPLKSLALRDPQAAECIGGATRRSFEKIIDLCLEEHVNALIIAGDLYDGDLRSMKTAIFLIRQMQRLQEANIRVFLIRGNHDSESSITKYLDFPKNVHVFTGRGGVEELEEFRVAIHGVSYAQRHAPESLLRKYRQPVAGFFNIGIMHTSLLGAAGHDAYAPCTVKDLASHGFNYWALGHIHQRCVYQQDPLIVMPGIPQGRDIGESGSGSVTFVEVSDTGIKIDERFTAEAEFKRVKIDLADVTEWPEMVEKLRRTIKEAQKAIQSKYLVCRTTLVGKSPLYCHIRRDIDRLREEARDAAKEIGAVFMEGVDNQLQPWTSRVNLADPVEELRSLMQEAAKNGTFCAEAGSFLETAMRQIPHELRDNYGVDMQVILPDLLTEGIADVIEMLKTPLSKSAPAECEAL